MRRGGGGGLAVLQRRDLVEQSAVAGVQGSAVQGAQGGGVALQLQQLALEAGTLLGDAVTLGSQGALGVGCGLRGLRRGGGGGLAVLQRRDLVKERLVGCVQRCTIQGPQGGGVALQLQQLALQALALAQDVGRAAQGLGDGFAGFGHIFQHRRDGGEGAAELNERGEVLAPGLGGQVLSFDQVAESVTRGRQRHAHAAQGLGQLGRDFGGALGFAEELLVVLRCGLGEVLQTAKGVGHGAGQVGASQAGVKQLQAQQLQHRVDGADAAGQAREGLHGRFARARKARAGGLDGAGNLADLVHVAVEHAALFRFAPTFHTCGQRLGHGAAGAQHKRGQVFVRLVECGLHLGGSLFRRQAVELDAARSQVVVQHVGAQLRGEGLDGIAAQAQRLSHAGGVGAQRLVGALDGLAFGAGALADHVVVRAAEERSARALQVVALNLACAQGAGEAAADDLFAAEDAHGVEHGNSSQHVGPGSRGGGHEPRPGACGGAAGGGQARRAEAARLCCQHGRL